MQEGQYAQAACMFTEAIKYDPKDYRYVVAIKHPKGDPSIFISHVKHFLHLTVSRRFFGNRSYCYYCLEQYPQALADAERSIQMAPDWPKGHFRKGSSLMGMKVGT